MAQGWASQILKDWSPQARTLSAEEELSCANRVADGNRSLTALCDLIAPSVGKYLDTVAGNDEILKSQRSDLTRGIVNGALDSFATSGQSAESFPKHLTRAFQETIRTYFDQRRHRSKNFWIDDDAWFEEHFDESMLIGSLDASIFDEATLWVQLAHGGQAVNDFVEHGLAVIPNVVWKLRNRGIEQLSREDAESEAVIALRKVAWKCVSAKDLPFHKLAFPAAKNHLFSKIRTAKGYSEHLARKFVRFDQVESRLWFELERRPTVSEVLAAINDWGDDAKKHFGEVLKVIQSFWDETPETLRDDLEGVPEITARKQRAEIVRAALRQLDEIERNVLICRYFLGRTKAETACQLGKSAAVVGRIEKKAKDKLLAQCRHVAEEP